VEEATPELARHFGLPEDEGLVVVRVETNSPAGEAGIRAGDLILEVDQSPVKALSDYQEAISSFQKGDTILFLIRRGGNTLYLTVKVWE